MKPIIRLDLFNPAITTVTATGPVTPTAGVDVSAVIGDWRVVCQVISQTAGKKYQVNLEGSADGFATRTVHLIAGGMGSIGPTADKVYSVRRHELDAWIIRFVKIEGSADGFATRTVHLIAGGMGSIGPTADKVYSVRRHELDAWIIGFVNGKLRCQVAQLDAGSSLQMRCWVEWSSSL